MSAKKSGQKWIAKNRAPRVQIEYDVEVYGSEKKVQIPFVMGVMADLAGKSEVEMPDIADRKFAEIDYDNFDARMKAMKPRVAFNVPNTLTGTAICPLTSASRAWTIFPRCRGQEGGGTESVAGGSDATA
jgi:type VI secretion system protein ImpB